MTALVLAGWSLAIGALLAWAIARGRMAGQAEAVARVCHELRGPLTAARLGLEGAVRSSEATDRRLGAIERELERASLVLEDLARVPRSTRGFMRASPDPAPEPARERIDVAELLADSVEAWRGAANRSGVTLRLADSAERPALWGERLRLAQAVANLIANAIEHGGGVVEVGCRVERARVRIEVLDGGPGLPAPVAELARRDRLGASSRRRGRFASRRWAASRRGHGLAIAGSVAAAHGGRLAAAPSQQGARLVLDLPLAGRPTVRAPAGG